MAAVVVAGIVLRIWILRTPQGALNADESYTGLQAMEILRGDVPVVFEGQAYTAVLESYVFAPFVWLFGAHIVALKLLPSLLWAVAAVLMHRVLRPIIGNAWAGAGASFLWLAPGASMVMSLRAYEGYASGMLVVVIAALAARTSLRSERTRARDSALVGAFVGLLVYIHPMFVAVAAPIALVPAWVHRRRLQEWWIPATVAAVVVNLPFIVWNVRNDWRSLDQPTTGDDSPITRLGRFFSELMPRALGLRDLDGDWTFGPAIGPIIGLVLLGVVVIGAVHLWRRGRTERVFVLPLVLAWPIMSLFGNLEYVADGRYGMIVLPFVVVDLVVGAAVVTSRIRRRSLSMPLVGVIAWVGLLVVPWAGANLGDRVGDPNADVREVLARLDEAGVSRVAGNFWWVLPLEFASDQRIRTAVVGNPFVIRMPESQRIVEAAPDEVVAFVFDANDDDVERLRLPIEGYERQVFGRAVLYVPLTA